MNETIYNMQEQIDEISKKFYQRKDSVAYKELDSLLQRILVFMQQLSLYTNQYTKEINKILGDAVEALQKKDGVLVADILRYDLNDILDQIKVEL